MRVKSNEEIFDMIQTHEILSESDCYGIEEDKAEFVTTIMDLFDIFIMEMVIAYLEQLADFLMELPDQ